MVDQAGRNAATIVSEGRLHSALGKEARETEAHANAVHRRSV